MSANEIKKNGERYGWRFLDKKQVAQILGLGKRIVDEMFATPGFPVRGGKNEKKYTWEPEFWPWVEREWRR